MLNVALDRLIFYPGNPREIMVGDFSSKAQFRTAILNVVSILPF
jgi:hypothetical protein